MGFGPTGGPVGTDVIDIAPFEDGMLVEHWGIADQMGLLLQVGFDPPPLPLGRRPDPDGPRWPRPERRPRPQRVSNARSPRTRIPTSHGRRRIEPANKPPRIA